MPRPFQLHAHQITNGNTKKRCADPGAEGTAGSKLCPSATSERPEKEKHESSQTKEAQLHSGVRNPLLPEPCPVAIEAFACTVWGQRCGPPTCKRTLQEASNVFCADSSEAIQRTSVHIQRVQLRTRGGEQQVIDDSKPAKSLYESHSKRCYCPYSHSQLPLSLENDVCGECQAQGIQNHPRACQNGNRASQDERADSKDYVTLMLCTSGEYEGQGQAQLQEHPKV